MFLFDHLPVVIAAIAALFSGVAASVAVRQAKSAEKQASLLADQLDLRSKDSRAGALFEIANRWSAIYPARNAVLDDLTIAWEDLHTKYGSDFTRFLNDDDDWISVREVCNFFEFLGMLLHGGYIDRDALFVLVTVDRFDDPRFPDGLMFSKLRGRIEYLRSVYRDDIYEYYDHFLLPEYRKYLGERAPRTNFTKPQRREAKASVTPLKPLGRKPGRWRLSA